MDSPYSKGQNGVVSELGDGGIINQMLAQRERAAIKLAKIDQYPLEQSGEMGWDQFGCIAAASGRSTIETVLLTEKGALLLPVCQTGQI